MQVHLCLSVGVFVEEFIFCEFVLWCAGVSINMYSHLMEYLCKVFTFSPELSFLTHPQFTIALVHSGEDSNLLGELPHHLNRLPVVTCGLFVIISLINLLRENF